MTKDKWKGTGPGDPEPLVFRASACFSLVFPALCFRLAFAEISNIAQRCLLVERVGFGEEGVAA